jgi:hypothetical protein
VVIGGLGVLAYNSGLAAGIAQSTQVVVQDGQPVTVVPYPYGPGWHGGFGFFGFIFWILGFFLIIGLLRAIFGWGRGGRGWGPGGPAKYGYYGYGGPGGDRVSEWHRELHRREEAQGSGVSPTPPNAPA